MSVEQVTCPFCGSIVYANVPDGNPEGIWDARYHRYRGHDVYYDYYYYLIAINQCPECGKEFYISKDKNGIIRTLKNLNGFSELNPTFRSQIKKRWLLNPILILKWFLIPTFRYLIRGW